MIIISNFYIGAERYSWWKYLDVYSVAWIFQKKSLKLQNGTYNSILHCQHYLLENLHTVYNLIVK